MRSSKFYSKPRIQSIRAEAEILLLILFILCSGAESGKANQQEAPNASSITEKRIGIGVPAHLPLKVKVKNLNSKIWVHDLEVEVTNTSDKPIYFLGFYLTLPGIKGPLGSTVGFWLRYGRHELMDFSTPLNSEDIPIKPSEKYTFKIPEGSANGWDYLKEKEGRREPDILKLVFQELNFGDGTGYADTSGSVVDIHKRTRPVLPGPSSLSALPTLTPVLQ
jgi:hypothetical protein